MSNKNYVRKSKEKKPVLAICYDFDKTLSPDDMQAQGYIQSVGYDVKSFWEESNSLAEHNDMDGNLAYMYKMIEESEGNFVFNKQKLEEYGSKVELFPGVNDWFERIREYGKKHGVIVEHYIISSGLKEMIEGTSVAKKGAFEKIYASSFYFNDRGVAKWPAQVVNYTNKTQFLFRISKGVLDVNDPGVNDYFLPSEIRVPFRNMIYIGDSDTDIPCMKLVNSYGGHSIGVYNPETNDKSKVYRMIKDHRIKFFEAADYSNGSGIDKLVKQIIQKTAENEALENIYYEREKEAFEYYKSQTDEEKEKNDLIDALDDSKDFKTTHSIIKELKKFSDWSDAQVEKLIKIALKNHPVRYIITDKDVKSFFKSIIKNTNQCNDDLEKLKELIMAVG